MKNLIIESVILILIVLVIYLFIVHIFLIKKINKQEKSLKCFMSGENGKSLEAYMKRRFKEIECIAKAQIILDKKVKKLVNTLGGSIQKVGIVKYDADEYIKGKASFAIAMIDSKNTGFIINSVNNGSLSYNYLKEIIDGVPKSKLSTEEKLALTYALESEVRAERIEEENIEC